MFSSQKLSPQNSLCAQWMRPGHAITSLCFCVHFTWIDLGIPYRSLQCVALGYNEACGVVG